MDTKNICVYFLKMYSDILQDCPVLPTNGVGLLPYVNVNDLNLQLYILDHYPVFVNTFGSLIQKSSTLLLMYSLFLFLSIQTTLAACKGPFMSPVTTEHSGGMCDSPGDIPHWL